MVQSDLYMVQRQTHSHPAEKLCSHFLLVSTGTPTPVRAGEVLVRLPVELQLMQHSDDEPRLLTGTTGIPGTYTIRPVFAPAAAHVVSSAARG